MTSLFSLQFLFSPDPFCVPNCLDSSAMADWVQIVNLPSWPPGARAFRFSLQTWTTSTPGMFLRALVSNSPSSLTITRGPFLTLYFFPLVLDTPALIVFPSITLSISSQHPNFFRRLIASLVFYILLTSLSKTKGSWGTLLILCPLAKIRGRTAVAEIALAKACLFSLRLIFRCHLLQV